MYKDGLENETKLHWQRNSYFLVSSSILLVVLGLSKEEYFRIALGVLGITINVIWFIIQDRSSRYVGYWKKEISKLKDAIKDFDIYPKNLGGIQMRYLGYFLPLPFIIVWIVVIIMAFYPDNGATNNLPNILSNLTRMFHP